MKATLLVSGASGYVGSHTSKFLAAHGYSVVGLDEVAPSQEIRRYLSDCLVADISSPNVIEFMRKNHVEGVVHCAAKCLVGESVEKPALYYDYNVRRSTAFLASVIAAGGPPLIFSSTAATYGEPIRLPITEDHPQKPINPYGETKLEFEKNLLAKAEEGALKVGIFRYFNAAGADPDGEIGEIHEPETHLIPNLILAALEKGRAFKIFGNDYPTRDGTCERDFVHVWDLAEAHTILLERIMKGGQGGIYNLGTSKGYTVAEVVTEVETQMKIKVRCESVERREGDPAVLVADSSKVRRELGWKGAYSDLPIVVSTALAWHRKTGSR